MAQVTLKSLGGKVVVQLNSDNQNQILTDPEILTYQSGYYLAGLNRWRRCRHICITKSQETYEQYILPLLIGSRFVDFSYGVSAGGKTTWQPWETHYIIGTDVETPSLSSTGAGFRFIMETADLIYTMRFVRRIRSRKGLISGIAQDIIASMEPSIPTNTVLNTVIEPTDLPHALIQAGENDYDFILERMVPLASNAQKTTNYSFYSTGDTLHFHTRGYQPGCTVHTLDYNISPTGSYDLHKIDDVGAEQVAGMFGITTISYDPLTGNTAQTPSDPTKVKILSNTQSNPQATTPWVLGRHVGQNTLQSETTGSQSQYELARSLGFGIRFSVVNYPALQLGDLVDLQSVATASNGLYHVVGMETKLVGGSATVLVTARRGEIYSQSQTANTSLVPSQIQTGQSPATYGEPAVGIPVVVSGSSSASQSTNITPLSSPDAVDLPDFNNLSSS